MYFNVYRTAPNNSSVLCLKKQFQIDTVEFLTGEMIGDTLPAIMSEEASRIYHKMRFMKLGETFAYKEFIIERI